MSRLNMVERYTLLNFDTEILSWIKVSTSSGPFARIRLSIERRRPLTRDLNTRRAGFWTLLGLLSHFLLCELVWFWELELGAYDGLAIRKNGGSLDGVKRSFRTR